MNKFEYFDVTADIGFYAYGNNLNEAFENAGLAIFNIISDTSNIKAEIEKTFEAAAPGRAAAGRLDCRDCSGRLRGPDHRPGVAGSTPEHASAHASVPGWVVSAGSGGYCRILLIPAAR